MPTLIITYMSGPEDGKTNVIPLDVNNAVATIGRLGECTISIPYDPDASRKHAQLSSRNGEWCLHDLGSAKVFLSANLRSHTSSPLRKSSYPDKSFVLGLRGLGLRKKVFRPIS